MEIIKAKFNLIFSLPSLSIGECDLRQHYDCWSHKFLYIFSCPGISWKCFSLPFSLSAYGSLTVRSLLDTREHCLNEFNFPDPYSKVGTPAFLYFISKKEMAFIYMQNKGLAECLWLLCCVDDRKQWPVLTVLCGWQWKSVWTILGIVRWRVGC